VKDWQVIMLGAILVFFCVAALKFLISDFHV